MTTGAEDRLRGRVAKVRHRDGDFAVVELAVAGVPLVAVGEAPGLAGLRPGQAVALDGEWTLHPEHGKRFKVEEVVSEDPGERVALDSAAGVRGWITPAELAARPGALDPPREVARGLAWAARLTLLSAPKKGGKSTLASAAAAAVTTGAEWLGRPAAKGRVAWLGLEEHPGDLIARLEDFGADLGRVVLPDPERVPEDRLELLVGVLDLRPAPALVVVDTLVALAGRSVADYSKGAQWQPVLDSLLRVARAGPAVLVLHHTRKSDGEARDSSAIPAAADVDLTMREDAALPAVRHVTGRGRWSGEGVSVALGPEGFRVVEPGAAGAAVGSGGIEGRVLAALAAAPGGLSKRAIRDAVEAQRAAVYAAVAGLEAAGRVALGGDGLYRLAVPGAAGEEAEPVRMRIPSAAGEVAS